MRGKGGVIREHCLGGGRQSGDCEDARWEPWVRKEGRAWTHCTAASPRIPQQGNRWVTANTEESKHGGKLAEGIVKTVEKLPTRTGLRGCEE